jgi:hypothetical protein
MGDYILALSSIQLTAHVFATATHFGVHSIPSLSIQFFEKANYSVFPCLNCRSAALLRFHLRMEQIGMSGIAHATHTRTNITHRLTEL